MKVTQKIGDILKYRVSETELPKYKARDFGKFLFGAAIIGGGIYGIVSLMLKKKEDEEIDTLTELRKTKQASAKPVTIQGRGVYR